MSGKNQGKVREFEVDDKWQPWCRRARSSIIWVFRPGPGCSKLMRSLVNVSLKFQKSVSQISQHFLLKKF